MPKKKSKLPLSKTHPKLAREANGWDPDELTSGSNRKMSWICPLGHKYLAMINSRTNGNTGCPYCANQKVYLGFNDLLSQYPDIAKQAFGWDPTTVTKRSGKKFNWICEHKHVWTSTVDNRVAGKGCPICDGKKILLGFNDLMTTHPKIALQSFGWSPTQFNAGSHKKVTWVCDYKHKWEASIASRTYQGTNCPICSNQRLLSGFNDLATTYPELASEAYGWDPSKVLTGTNKRLNWICKKSHVYSAPANRRINQSSGCPYCSNRLVLTGFNDLATTNPKLASEAVGWDPSKFIAGDNRLFTWICTEGHKWKAQLNSRNSGVGCPSCANSGFDPNENGFLYLLIHNSWNMFQIGITNKPDNRLADHKRLGWELLELRGPMDGHLTQQWETAILRMLRAKGADLSNKEVAGKFDGYSEAWSKTTFPAKSLKELMRLTEEFEDSLKI